MTTEADERVPWSMVYWLKLLSGGSLPRIHWYLTAQTECHSHTGWCDCGGKRESIIFNRLGDFHRDSSTSRPPKRNLVKVREEWFIQLGSHCLHDAASFLPFSATPSPTRKFTWCDWRLPVAGPSLVTASEVGGIPGSRSAGHPSTHRPAPPSTLQSLGRKSKNKQKQGKGLPFTHQFQSLPRDPFILLKWAKN